MSTATTYGQSQMEHLWGYLQGLPMNGREQRWLAQRLMDSAAETEPQPRRYTLEEVNAMIDRAEVEIAAGKGTPHEEVMREWEEELAREKHLEFELAEAI